MSLYVTYRTGAHVGFCTWKLLYLACTPWRGHYGRPGFHIEHNIKVLMYLMMDASISPCTYEFSHVAYMRRCRDVNLHCTLIIRCVDLCVQHIYFSYICLFRLTWLYILSWWNTIYIWVHVPTYPYEYSYIIYACTGRSAYCSASIWMIANKNCVLFTIVHWGEL